MLVVERRGPLRALRRSGQIIRERWAEGIGGATPIALATLVVVLPLVGLVFIGLVLYVTGLTAPGLLAMSGGAVAIVAVCIVSGAVAQIFTLAVFQHATGGDYYEGFPAADLERPREGKPLRWLRLSMRFPRDGGHEGDPIECDPSHESVHPFTAALVHMTSLQPTGHDHASRHRAAAAPEPSSPDTFLGARVAPRVDTRPLATVVQLRPRDPLAPRRRPSARNRARTLRPAPGPRPRHRRLSRYPRGCASACTGPAPSTAAGPSRLDVT